MKVVIDTNVLISSLFWKGIPRRIIDCAIRRQIQSITSIEILNELQSVLMEDFQVPPARMNEILRDILGYSQIVEPKPTVIKIRDTKDIKVLACAAAGGVDYVVTGDKDLLIIGEFDRIKIVAPAEFIKLI